MYAHTLNNLPPAHWEPLEQHLAEVAELASAFAQPFSASALAHIAGLWHDVGKFSPQFQSYLVDSHAGRTTSPVEHSTAGALHAQSTFGNTGLAKSLGFIIAGHHAGLADLGSASSPDESSLTFRLTNTGKKSEIAAALLNLPPHIAARQPPPLPSWLVPSPHAPLRIALFIRFVFSCLIDADRLATERFVAPSIHAYRAAKSPSISQLRAALDDHLARFIAARRSNPAPTDAVRAELLESCRTAAALPPGLFSLTAPTGSGKTLSSMAFALNHAEIHGLRRVVYALPFTSVTEQNAEVFRTALNTLGDNVVLEHHSAFRPSDADEDAPSNLRRRLATENWDAPVVVTTNVQLLESLFAARPSTCRKLHRLAQSVIILDEAQSLPVHLLRPTLAALQELTNYGATVVLCSATMPAVLHRHQFPIGLRAVREIVPSPTTMARALRRARVDRIGHVDDAALAAQIISTPRALCIVNTRAHAARLFALVRAGAKDALHLSALMCPAHRSRRVAEIKSCLTAAAPCRVISTQVVEAGVDIDFPVVLRAMAGLDSIVQAAGRCNREGRGPLGQVSVFDTDEPPPQGIRPAIDAARQILMPGVDPLDLTTIESFFNLHYWQKSSQWDGRLIAGRSVAITEMLAPSNLQFKTAAAEYKLIDDWSEPIVVPFTDEGRAICATLLSVITQDVSLLRRAQQYTVSISPRIMTDLLDKGYAAPTASGPTVLTQPSLYDDSLGLQPDQPSDPVSLFA